MPVAFVLLNTEIGAMVEVLKELKKVNGVKEAYSVFGVYDLIAKVEAENMADLKKTITWKIRKLNQVRTTLTMMVIE